MNALVNAAHCAQSHAHSHILYTASSAMSSVSVLEDRRKLAEQTTSVGKKREKKERNTGERRTLCSVRRSHVRSHTPSERRLLPLWRTDADCQQLLIRVKRGAQRSAQNTFALFPSHYAMLHAFSARNHAKSSACAGSVPRGARATRLRNCFVATLK